MRTKRFYSRSAYPPSPQLVPAYFGPWEFQSWEALFRARPAVVIINPESGPHKAPLTSSDAKVLAYLDLVNKLRDLQIVVLGYVSVSWFGLDPQNSAELAQRHREFYGVDGIFWDEIAVDHSSLGHLKVLDTISTDNGFLFQCFNPGREIPRSWGRLFPRSIWVTFEGNATTYLAQQVGSQRNSCHLVYGASQSAELLQVRNLIGRRKPKFSYVTSDGLDNPWDVFCAP